MPHHIIQLLYFLGIWVCLALIVGLIAGDVLDELGNSPDCDPKELD